MIYHDEYVKNHDLNKNLEDEFFFAILNIESQDLSFFF